MKFAWALLFMSSELFAQRGFFPVREAFLKTEDAVKNQLCRDVPTVNNADGDNCAHWNEPLKFIIDNEETLSPLGAVCEGFLRDESLYKAIINDRVKLSDKMDKAQLLCECQKYQFAINNAGKQKQCFSKEEVEKASRVIQGAFLVFQTKKLREFLHDTFVAQALISLDSKSSKLCSEKLRLSNDCTRSELSKLNRILKKTAEANANPELDELLPEQTLANSIALDRKKPIQSIDSLVAYENEVRKAILDGGANYETLKEIEHSQSKGLAGLVNLKEGDRLAVELPMKEIYTRASHHMKDLLKAYFLDFRKKFLELPEDQKTSDQMLRYLFSSSASGQGNQGLNSVRHDQFKILTESHPGLRHLFPDVSNPDLDSRVVTFTQTKARNHFTSLINKLGTIEPNEIDTFINDVIADGADHNCNRAREAISRMCALSQPGINIMQLISGLPKEDLNETIAGMAKLSLQKKGDYGKKFQKSFNKIGCFAIDDLGYFVESLDSRYLKSNKSNKKSEPGLFDKLARVFFLEKIPEGISDSQLRRNRTLYIPNDIENTSVLDVYRDRAQVVRSDGTSQSVEDLIAGANANRSQLPLVLDPEYAEALTRARAREQEARSQTQNLVSGATSFKDKEVTDKNTAEASAEVQELRAQQKELLGQVEKFKQEIEEFKNAQQNRLERERERELAQAQEKLKEREQQLAQKDKEIDELENYFRRANNYTPPSQPPTAFASSRNRAGTPLSPETGSTSSTQGNATGSSGQSASNGNIVLPSGSIPIERAQSVTGYVASNTYIVPAATNNLQLSVAQSAAYTSSRKERRPGIVIRQNHYTIFPEGVDPKEIEEAKKAGNDVAIVYRQDKRVKLVAYRGEKAVEGLVEDIPGPLHALHKQVNQDLAKPSPRSPSSVAISHQKKINQIVGEQSIQEVQAQTQKYRLDSLNSFLEQLKKI